MHVILPGRPINAVGPKGYSLSKPLGVEEVAEKLRGTTGAAPFLFGCLSEKDDSMLRPHNLLKKLGCIGEPASATRACQDYFLPRPIRVRIQRMSKSTKVQVLRSPTSRSIRN